MPSLKMLAVSGEKNSGKTTLIARLLPRLVAEGLKVAVVKHDGHSFSPDVPGTDTHRFLQAGALGAAVFDGEKYMLTKLMPTDEVSLAAQYPEADLILLEGLKHSSHPKLRLSAQHQVGFSFSPAQYHRDDIDAIFDTIMTWYGGDQTRD